MDAAPCDVLVIGGGPAGLRASEIASAAGQRTVLTDHKPSVGRKLLVAGRGGLNLTHSEPLENFPARYAEDEVGRSRWRQLLENFSPDDLRTWARDLGIETFVGTSGRVFPESKQAAPLLRRWVERLRRQGVAFRLRHEFTGLERWADGSWRVAFSTSTGAVKIDARSVILALGGASWPQTGSTGTWTRILETMGVALTPFAPANCGYETRWPASFLADAEGLPLKNIRVRASGDWIVGELLVTRYGLEGGALYQLGRELRNMSAPQIRIDLKPSLSVEQLALRLGSASAGGDLVGHAARAWRLGVAARALLRLHEPFGDASALAQLAKNLPVRFTGPRPIAEAISSAGGVPWSELDDHLMLQRLPGLFCAGEMIDWEAPTGGYLLQGCLATATCAARGALEFMDGSRA